MDMILKGRVIKEGEVIGEALVSHEPIGFLGGVDPETGRIIEKNHPLKGESVKGKILVFPYGKGSTVGSYIIYRMKKKGTAPVAIINKECEPIIAVGAIIADIPCIDRIDISKIKTGDRIKISKEKMQINERK